MTTPSARRKRSALAAKATPGAARNERTGPVGGQTRPARAGKAAQPQPKRGQAAVPSPDVEARRSRLKTLIDLGKDRGYLTYGEINDHLLDDMLDAEQMENVTTMIADIGIRVCDQAPDVETLLMIEPPAGVSDREVADVAEA